MQPRVEVAVKEVASMRRIMLVLAVVAVMVAMMVAMVAPAFAKSNQGKGWCNPGSPYIKYCTAQRDR